MLEIWKPIPEYEGLYEVSNFGRIKSILLTGRILKPAYNSSGYLLVSLVKDSIKKSESIHRLVLKAFVGYPQNGHEACHNNGDRSDNNICNLRWDTRKGNFVDRDKHGTTAVGSRNGWAKLNESLVTEIRKDCRSNRQIAKTYNVSSVCIDKIKNRTTWKHI